MASWAAFFSALGLIVSIASLLDKVYENSTWNGRYRNFLIATYLWMEKYIPALSHLRFERLSVALLILAQVLLVLAFWSVAGLLVMVIGEVGPFGSNSSIQSQSVSFLFLKINLLFIIVPLVVVSLVPVVTIIPLLGMAFYPFMRRLVVYFLDRGSHPKVSPLAYTAAVLGVCVAFGKLVIDVIKSVE